MKFCFGTLANVLLLCGVEGIQKIKLVNTICKSVDPSCKLSSSAVTALLQCTSNLPDNRSNGLGNVISKAKEADPRKVAEYFSKKVIPVFLDNNKRKLAVLAIRELIAKDDYANDDIFEIISGKRKKALLMQSKFVLSEFLAGVFLFAAQLDNKVGKEAAEETNWDFVVSFVELQDTISFVVPKKEGEIIDNASEAFIDYLENIKEKFGSDKTLLHSNTPTPFYSFYVPNRAVHSIGGVRNALIADVSAESLTALSNFLIVEGIGGLGKTMMMYHLLLSAIDNFPKLRRVPVFMPLRDYNEEKKELREFVFSVATNYNPSITQEDFFEGLKNGLFLLLFDGLDEIDQVLSGRFEREIENFSDRYPKNCFVISSRPFQSFVSFTRFSRVKLQPFTKEQALEFVDKVEFRPDQPEIKRKFHATLDKHLYKTHRSFAQNPLLLTIMLLTFERYAEVPSKMHIFYREAFLTLAVTHDATKGAFARPLKTGLHIDDIEMYFAEICFRSYRDGKYEFTDAEFSDYFAKLSKGNKSKPAGDFLYDLHHNLCIMYFEGGKYRFIHRSFQEYFAAVFMSKQTDEFIGKLGSFFEKRASRVFTNSAFPMLYDIIPERVEQFVFEPYLAELFAKCDAEEGYWTFLEEEFPVIYYESGDVEESAVNEPQSYILEFILKQLDYKYAFTTDDLPFYESLVEEEVTEDTVPLLVEEVDSYGNVVGQTICNWPYYELDEDEEPPEPEIVGHKLEFIVEDVRRYPDKYTALLAVLDKDGFVFKVEYGVARAYMMLLTEKIQARRDDLNDLL